MTVTLHAYQYSVYARIARMVLFEKGVAYEYTEVNPFSPDMPAEYLGLHPFRRVPVLVHDDFEIYETGAITRYIDEAFEGAILQPVGIRARARMAQIISVIDAYCYWPMIRQVFSHRVFRPRTGRPADENEIRSGIEASERALSAIETLMEQGGFLTGGMMTLADLHLAPMMAYFVAVSEGQAMLARHLKLCVWWDAMRERPSVAATDPGRPVA